MVIFLFCVLCISIVLGVSVVCVLFRLLRVVDRF